ncbi:MAG: LptE family protein [Sediminibacterium sp.]
MISKNKISFDRSIRHSYLYSWGLALAIAIVYSSCGIYKFNDASIDPNIKTVKIGYIDNKARYVNPQFAAKLTDKIQQKIISATKLTRTNNDDADYVINGVITTYDGSQTVGVSSTQAAANRLTVTVHIVWRKNKENKTEEFDVSRSFDYPATQSFSSAEAQLSDEVVRNLTDDIFNRIFSNW